MRTYTFATQHRYKDGTISRLEYPIDCDGIDEEDAKSKLPSHHVSPRLIGIDDPTAGRDFLRDPVRLM